ncbi:hypothetical protein BU25DRAFT_479004 [Macroventuria anomochaeta]|uniref:Uncharacterized protein n=1 Tax=Macroventuria anomochaeta TaxID=301207 RepID=A0ACB6SBC7_9PLEO|nr:uncharacterized protein BU25DRAFT_479004 [Macroventuria anomochaeta]KAF2631436.1 hypothetical protein BU25DRAFT_479004 [Macroventuria anomochaeta]
MYFVGRKGSRIYFMWDPVNDKVICTSSVTWSSDNLGTVKADTQLPPVNSDAEKPVLITFRPLTCRPQAARHLNISANVEGRNIIDGPRKRRPTEEMVAAIALYNPYIPVALARCFATAIAQAPSATPLQFPPELVNGKQTRQHVYSKDWLLAEAEEYKSHNDNGTWGIVIILPPGM